MRRCQSTWFTFQGSTAQQQDLGAVLLLQEGQFVDVAQLLAAMQHGEQRRRREDREQLQEVAAAVGGLALAAQPQDPGFLPEDFTLKHPGDDLLDSLGGHSGEGRDAYDPAQPIPTADAAFLQAERHQLLGEDVVRFRRRDHRFDVPGRQEVDQPGGLD